MALDNAVNPRRIAQSLHLNARLVYNCCIMRDIRDDLRERLDDIAAERAKLQAQVGALEALEATYKVALREEETRVGKNSPASQVNPLPFPRETPTSYVLTFIGPVIKQIMRAKGRPLASDEIKDSIIEAKAFDFGEKAPGRSVHFGLVSLKNGGEIERLPDGRWFLARNGVPVQGEVMQ
jgi:hypothetical protein